MLVIFINYYLYNLKVLILIIDINGMSTVVDILLLYWLVFYVYWDWYLTVSTTSPQHMFSTLKRVKTYLINTMGQVMR